MSLTDRGLNRATLARQLLLRRERLSVVDALRRVVALQAQEPASPYLALWNRVTDLDPADVDEAFESHAVVKATLIRITLHAVLVEDYSAFHQAMVPSLRASRLNDDRFRKTGLTADDADALVPGLLELTAEPRTSSDIEAWLEERMGVAIPRLWWALRTFAPVVHAPTGARWSHGNRPAYVAARTPAGAGDRAASVQRLVRRYLEGFGPASAQDIGQFTILRMPVVSEALAAMADTLSTLESPSGGVLHDVPDAPLPDESTPAPPRLMAMWDSSLLAYADRSRIVPPDYRTLVFRKNGDVLPTLLVDGYVAGVWRPVDGGIEATAFHELPADAWDGLATEAKALVGFLANREPDVYRRYVRWWDSLPTAETRRLPD
jgi:hypothetical protein